MAVITNEDLALVLQQSAAPQTAKLKIEVLDTNKRLAGTIYGIASGSVSINGESDIRRTASLVIQPTLAERLRLSEDSLLWLNKDIRISVGLYNIRTRDYRYYPLGYYVYTNASGTYDSATNQLSISCADFIKKLDGTKNGQIGNEATTITVATTDPETGETNGYHNIRQAMIDVIEKIGHITNHRIDEIGSYKAFAQYNENWEGYRQENEDWNRIPYDLEFSCGCSLLSILNTFRDLYNNYELFFEPEDNTLVCQRIPIGYEDDILLHHDFIQKILISENTSLDLTAIRNICEIRGQLLEPKYYAEACTYDNGIYHLSVKEFEKYQSSEKVAARITAENEANPQLNINELGPIPIYMDNSEKPIEPGTIKADTDYVFLLKKKTVDKKECFYAYFLGQGDVHVMDVLTNGKKSSEKYIAPTGQEYELYSKEYFEYVYNCPNVNLTIVAGSPFTVQKLGEILDVKTGGDYEKYISVDTAAEQAAWENRRNSILTDSITITTLLLPFLDVNKKISYQPSDADEERQYIIKSISHDFASFTSTITMYRFYPSHDSLLKEAGTHKVLSDHSHGVLGKYTYEELTTIISGEEL